MRKSSRVLGAALIAVALGTAIVWYADFSEDRAGRLTVSFLNIGQGDAIFIDAPTGRQVLIDGGRDDAVLRRLAAVMPWYDRSIDVVIATHPDADHVGGLVDVLAHYNVGMIMHSSVEGNTKTFAALNAAIQKDDVAGAKDATAVRGQIIDLGNSAYLEVLFPDRAVPHVATNDGCVVTRLVYGDTAFMFSCDAPQEIENYLVALASTPLGTSGTTTLKADVLKAGHHGSKYSSSPLFLGTVDPAYGVFSRGCDNRYGHPAPEVVARFKQFGIPTLDTCTDGTITFVSDGKTVTLE